MICGVGSKWGTGSVCLCCRTAFMVLSLFYWLMLWSKSSTVLLMFNQCRNWPRNMFVGSFYFSGNTVWSPVWVSGWNYALNSWSVCFIFLFSINECVDSFQESKLGLRIVRGVKYNTYNNMCGYNMFILSISLVIFWIFFLFIKPTCSNKPTILLTSIVYLSLTFLILLRKLLASSSARLHL